MKSLLLEQVLEENKAKEFGVNVFERVWLDEKMSLVNMSDIKMTGGKLVQEPPLWLPSFGVGRNISRLIEDLRPVERTGAEMGPEEWQRVEDFLKAGLPAVAAVHAALNTELPVASCGRGGPVGFFGIAGPPGVEKSTVLAELSRRTEYPIAVIEPRYSEWSAAAYGEVLARAGTRNYSESRQVIGDYLGPKNVEKKTRGSGGLRDTRPLRAVLDGVLEMFEDGGVGGKRWVLCDLGGWPRVKSLGYVGAWEKSRGLNIFDVLPEGLEGTREMENAPTGEEGEKIVRELEESLKDDKEGLRKRREFVGAVRKRSE